MEKKSQIPRHRPPQSKPIPKPSPSPDPKSSRPAVWDCGSSLYDSFERTSFQRHLDSAITATSARSLSMPHLTDRRLDLPPSAPPTTPRSKLSRSFQKLLRSVFSHKKSKPPSGARPDSGKEKARFRDLDADLAEKETARWFVVYEDDGGVCFEKDRKEKGVALTTIAEAPEAEKKAGLMSPEIGSAVRKTMSERFSPASVSNLVHLISSCA